ncbi:PKD domain-containing protein [Aestuariibacter salexigens]|uniref:PKD domain-containing protein n=1 Tax=Aestuariibacter salexigens TaxID=226010 RepID=UPI000479E4CF|nr:PKD domain-containing protein [Aestuariibacter salexigens]
MTKLAKLLSLIIFVFILSACGSDSNNDNNDDDDTPPSNVAPNADAGSDQNVDEQTTVTLDGSGSNDSDGTISSYSWRQTAGSSVTLGSDSAATSTFTAPTLTVAETLTFELTVTDDDGDTSTDSVDVTVNPVNAPPIAIAGPDQAVSEQSLVTLDGSASSDDDGSIDYYNWQQTGGSNVALSDASDSQPTFTAPTLTVAETLTFDLTVTDNEGESGVDSVSVTVNPVNASPSVDAGIDQTVNEQTTVTLDGVVSDSDGSITSIDWNQLDGPTVTLSDTSITNPTFTSPVLTVVDEIIFELTAVDNEGASESDSVSITVTPVNDAPTANAGVDQVVDEQSEVTLNGSGSSDDDGNIDSYEWQQTSGTDVTLSDSAVANPTFTAPDISEDETLTFELTVTDNEGASDTDSVDVQVTAIIDNSIPASEIQTAIFVHELALVLDDFVGEKVWVVGYFGNSEYNLAIEGMLVDHPLRLTVREGFDHHSVAVLTGVLPADDWNESLIMVYGTVTNYSDTDDTSIDDSIPLINVEKFTQIEEARTRDTWDFDLFVPSVDPNTVQGSGDDDYHSTSRASHPTHNHIQPLPPVYYHVNDVTPNQAQACDRALIISGGIDALNNSKEYQNGVAEGFKKLKELGFGDDQIGVYYNNGGTINVNNSNIVDSDAGKSKIKAYLDELAANMPGSCTLTIFVSDHGTGYSPEEGYRGARIATPGSAEATEGLQYDENTFKIDARKKVIYAAAKQTIRDKLWLYNQTGTGDSRLYQWTPGTNGESGKWELKSSVDAGDSNIFPETDIGIDLNNDGSLTSDYGFAISYFADKLSANPVAYRTNSWDTDGDGSDDVRLRWDGVRFVIDRENGDTWTEIGRDTNGDFYIDIIDGGVDWNMDGDKADKVAFHEGINLWGNEVLWDDEMATWLKTLSDKGVHILFQNITCFSGGFASNVDGIVESYFAGSNEQETHGSLGYDQAKKEHFSVAELSFFANLTGIDPESWNMAVEAAIAADNAQADARNFSRNSLTHTQTPTFDSSSLWQELDGQTDQYKLQLDLPDNLVGTIYDFEFIHGLQKPRWPSMAFLNDLPEGMMVETIGGGIRVYSDSPIPDGVYLEFEVPGTDLESDVDIRVEYTDQQHDRLGYTMVDYGTVETPLPVLEATQVENCVNHTDHGQSSPSILEYLITFAVLNQIIANNIYLTLEVTPPGSSPVVLQGYLTAQFTAYFLLNIYSYGIYNFEIISALYSPTSQYLELSGDTSGTFEVTAAETNKGNCAP